MALQLPPTAMKMMQAIPIFSKPCQFPSPTGSPRIFSGPVLSYNIKRNSSIPQNGHLSKSPFMAFTMTFIPALPD
jgi:hypothetical protein